MNERIRSLADQAGFIDKGTNHTAYMEFDHEKFAQLIVAECVGLCQYESEDDDNQLDLGMVLMAKEISYRIKKHFWS